jgi:predicted DNA-binding transcriptional regulator AlpA
MIDLQVLKENPELAKSVRFEMSGFDLLTVTDELSRRAVEAEKSKKIPAPEEYLTGEEFAKILKISSVTLWNYDKRGLTIPVRIGNSKRYRRSDIEKVLQSGLVKRYIK